MEYDLLQTISSTVKYRLAEQPELGAQRLATQLGCTCSDIHRLANNDPTLALDMYIFAALHLGIEPEFVRMIIDYRQHG
ncbi:hypothetical protein KO507_18145 [Gilvimarinus agarilyticus]|uniref:hypothetical protein n=1 Tax=Gilvimarinus sp. 2_MG-2023 TaxID=3062666 RepID=UPI001C085746|nr:hypothetical protein [Gilvimarinus sp. 2_MG-2023]MBU2887691.1 hypothetical protein [Gilvimarinus agarilyticus]MDO6572339.1 hypothetical protein [Gilvimarinus sp. 2_MG-2023]